MAEACEAVRCLLHKSAVAKDGFIDRKALADVLSFLDPGIQDPELPRVLCDEQSGQNGRVSIDLFVDWVFRSSAIAQCIDPEKQDGIGHKAHLIDGKRLADSVLASVKSEVLALFKAGHDAPALVVVLVGDNPASASYIKRKEAAAAQCGILCRVLSFASTISQYELACEVERLNADPHVHGIIVQLPLPAHLDAPSITGAVARSKDVDGFAPENIGSVALNGFQPTFCPCTPKGCMFLLHSLGISLRGKEAVVVGASNIVGIPMTLLLLKEGCTVSVCHIDTVDPAVHTRTADILVVAVGKAGLVRGDWVKPGAIVIDVGINFVDDPSKKAGKRLVGDVAFDEVSAVASHITPVPGGVGPMTVAMLMQNALDAKKYALSAVF